VPTTPTSNQISGATDLRASKTVETDSNGASYETDYGSGNGLLDVIPETTGSFTNNAQETYTETDPGESVGANGETATTVRTQNADGSYSETVAIPLLGLTNTNLVNSDFSAQEELLDFGGGYIFAAPTGGSIVYSFYPTTTPTSTTLDPTAPEFPPSLIPDWVPATQITPSVETDTITDGVALDPRCQPTAKYSGTPNLVKQVLTISDTAQGTLETRTTQTFDIAGIGTVCTTVDDTVLGYYDYSGQTGPSLLDYVTGTATPITTITTSEVLALATINGSTTASAVRQTASATSAGIGTAYLPRSIAVSDVEHRVHQAVLRKVQEARAIAKAVKGAAK
jgi:hypothetical protein